MLNSSMAARGICSKSHVRMVIIPRLCLTGSSRLPVQVWLAKTSIDFATYAAIVFGDGRFQSTTSGVDSCQHCVSGTIFSRLALSALFAVT